MNALGLIEVYSFTTALCVADLMAKAADVKVIAFDRNRPFAKGFPVPLIMAVKIEKDTIIGSRNATVYTQYICTIKPNRRIKKTVVGKLCNKQPIC